MKKLAVILWLCGVLLMGMSPPARSGQTFKLPWRLALVVEQSAARDRALGSTKGRQALRQALQMELRTLPLRIEAGLWAAGERGPVKLLEPGPAVTLRGQKLNLAAGTGKAGLDAALAQAVDWLLEHDGGSLLILGVTPPAKWRPPSHEGLYTHVIYLGRDPAPQAFENLALESGGAMWSLKNLQAMPTLIRQAVATAISPVSLVFETRDEQNRPQKARALMQDAKIKDSVRAIATLRPAQVKAGAYKLTWSDADKIGPGPLPDKVTVGFEGQTRVWVGGSGHLNIRALDAKGHELTWQLQITRVVDGEVVKNWHMPPSRNKLPSGYYIVNSRSPRHSWLVELGAGQTKELLAGPKAGLLARLQGPDGPVRLPYQVYDQLSGRRVATGYSGNKLRLMPGGYRLELELPPGFSRQISLKPEESRELEFPPAGALLVLVEGPKKPFTLKNLQDKDIAQGMPGRPLHLLPGNYKVLPFGSQTGLPVKVEAGRTTELKL